MKKEFEEGDIKITIDYDKCTGAGECVTACQVEIFSVDIDDSKTSQQIQSFRDEFENQLDIELNWIFGKGDGSIWQKYMINGGIPTLCIFDQKGSLSFQREGAAVFSEIPSGWPEDTVTLAQKIDDLM